MQARAGALTKSVSLLAAVIAAAAATAPATELSAKPRDRNGRISFELLHGPCTSAAQCNFEVHTMRPDGTDIRQITRTEFEERGAEWSPDGRSLAFFMRNDIWLMNAAGAGLTNLTRSATGEFWPSWSPDGGSITFNAFAPSSSPFITIGIMRADGSEQRELARGPGDVANTSWSPDGTRIVYVQYTPLLPALVRDSLPVRTASRLYTMGADGSNPTPIRPPTLGSDDFPDWSSTDWIVFSNDEGASDWEIFKMRPDGSELVQLTDNGEQDRFPEWSPDGRWIVFVRGSSSGNEIFKMRADGRREVQLTSFGGRTDSPSWQPD